MRDKSDLKHWHDRAARARAEASRVKDPRSKQRLLGLADAYESLAARIDQRAWKHTSERLRGSKRLRP